MKIAQKYLDEIELICVGTTLSRFLLRTVHSHWVHPRGSSGLFAKCAPTGFGVCGCLTQIRAGTLCAIGWDSAIDKRLTDEIKADTRLAGQPGQILPAHLRQAEYPLTEEQKQEVRECLRPYAEWQTRLRLKFNDTPEDQLNLVEVP